MISDIIDGLKLVADGINSIRAIQEAVKSGANYIKSKRPEVRSDLKEMITELGKSLSVIKRASAVLTNFHFAISADVRGSELTRFNDYFIRSKDETQYLQDHIEDLRTHCHKIRAHAEKISGDAGTEGFAKVFHIIGLNSPALERELGQKLEHISDIELEFTDSATTMLGCLEAALKAVQDTLGTGGAMYPENIPAAAAVLADLGPEFEKMEEKAAEGIREVTLLTRELA